MGGVDVDVDLEDPGVAIPASNSGEGAVLLLSRPPRRRRVGFVQRGGGQAVRPSCGAYIWSLWRHVCSLAYFGEDEDVGKSTSHSLMPTPHPFISASRSTPTRIASSRTTLLSTLPSSTPWSSIWLPHSPSPCEAHTESNSLSPMKR
jgi:hypothetical protein